MFALKRIAAYVIDFVLIYIPITAAVNFAEIWLAERLGGPLHSIAAIGGWGLSLFATALVIGTLTGLTGRTPGKLITFLRIHDSGNDPPGIPQGILREIIKMVSLGFFFGMILALHGLVTKGQTFYDEWLDLEVEDLNPYGLTPTQKKFRKYMRDQARLKKG